MFEGPQQSLGGRETFQTKAHPQLGGGWCDLDLQEVNQLLDILHEIKKKKSRIKEEATFRDSGSVFSNTPGSNVLFLENESQALFVVTGERKQPKPIWLSEAVP